MSITIAIPIIEDILKASPTSPTFIDALRLVTPQQWSQLGTDGIYIWGQLPGDKTLYYRAGKPINVAVDLSTFQLTADGMTCDCREVSPCRHSLALLLLFRESIGMLPRAECPAFVRERFPGKSGNQLRPDDLGEEIRRGLAQLDLWLTHLIREGLAQPHVRAFSFWDEMADRMLAAWMPGLSQWLREIANIPVRGGDWVEPLLAELGQLYLLVKSFERFEELPFTIQADLRQAVGTPINQAFDRVSLKRDDWIVIGRHRRILRNRVPEHVVWLYGLKSRQMAVLHSLGSEAVMKSLDTKVGHVQDATLLYLPSRAPLKALLIESYGEKTSAAPEGWRIEESIVMFGKSLAANPWLRYFPLLLENVYVSRSGKHWIVRHEDGVFLPIMPHFKHNWVMLAAGAGKPMTIAGIWNGNSLLPLSVFADKSVIDLNTLMNYT